MANCGWSTTSISPDRPWTRTAGPPGNGLRIEHAIANDPQAPFLLRDQHRAVRKEGQAPRIHQAASDRDDADPHDFGGVVFDGLGWNRLRLESSRSDWDAAVEGNCLLGRAGRLDGEERDGRAEEKPGPVAESWKPHVKSPRERRLVYVARHHSQVRQSFEPAGRRGESGIERLIRHKLPLAVFAGPQQTKRPPPAMRNWNTTPKYSPPVAAAVLRSHKYGRACASVRGVNRNSRWNAWSTRRAWDRVA